MNQKVIVIILMKMNYKYMKKIMNYKINQTNIDKYKLFFKLLEDDLIGYVDENKKLNEEMHDIEEEKDYFLGKLQNINIFCENQNNKSQNIKTKEHCTNIINIITNVPHDFQ